MAKKLTDEEKLHRANELLAEAEQLLANEPADSHLHGGWIVKIRSLIGRADRYRRQCEVTDVNYPTPPKGGGLKANSQASS